MEAVVVSTTGAKNIGAIALRFTGYSPGYILTTIVLLSQRAMSRDL